MPPALLSLVERIADDLEGEDHGTGNEHNCYGTQHSSPPTCIRERRHYAPETPAISTVAVPSGATQRPCDRDVAKAAEIVVSRGHAAHQKRHVSWLEARIIFPYCDVFG